MNTGVRKTRILFYSDCPFFGGCENMLASLLNSSGMHQNFDIIFAYCRNEVYEKGLHSRLKLKINKIPVRLPTIFFLYDIIDKIKIRPARKILKGIAVIALLPYWFFLYDIFRLFFVFRKTKPDILHINNGGYPGAYSCLAAVFAAKLAGIKKIVFVVNNIVVPYNSFFRYLNKPIDKFVQDNVTIFMTGSKYAADRLRDLWNLSEGKVINIHNTIIPHPVFEPKESVLKRLGIGPGRIILGSVAILERRKGQKYLIEALAIIREKFPAFKNVMLIMVGEGSMEEYLKKTAVNLNLTSNILFLKNDNNIFDVISVFDIFVLSSIEYEDFPYVILEAMSLGKPVVGTRIAGVPEQIEDSISGFIVDPGDAELLSQAILTLIQDEEMRSRMGISGQNRFNRLFSYNKVVDRYIGLYRDVISCNKYGEMINDKKNS